MRVESPEDNETCALKRREMRVARFGLRKDIQRCASQRRRITSDAFERAEAYNAMRTGPRANLSSMALWRRRRVPGTALRIPEE